MLHFPSDKRNLPRFLLFLLCEIFSLGSAIYFLCLGAWVKLLLCLVTLLLVALPELVERLGHCKLNTAFYLFGIFYAIGPMLGHAYDLYHRLPGFDKLLHGCGGLAFAFIGAYLPLLRFPELKRDRIMRMAFALCFSIAISAVWEFYEFSADRLVGTDMQQDTVITEIHSYHLGEGPGDIGHITEISSVAIDGEPLPVDGYLDIGLFDTMGDMMIETLGALVYVVIFLLDRDRHPALVRK